MERKADKTGGSGERKRERPRDRDGVGGGEQHRRVGAWRNKRGRKSLGSERKKHRKAKRDTDSAGLMFTLNETQRWPATSRRGWGERWVQGVWGGVSSQCLGPSCDAGNTDDRFALSAGVLARMSKCFVMRKGRNGPS